MADLTYIEEAQEVKITGQDSTGNRTNYVSADSSGNMAVKNTAAGPVTPGAVATNSALIGGQFNTALPTLTNTQQAAFQLDSSGRLILSPLASTSTVTANQGSANTVANGWPVKITDGTDTAAVATNSQLKVVDGLANGGVYGSLSVPTANTAVEAKVGASRLTNRKFLQIYSNNNGLFWGLDSSVTTSNGQPLVNGQVITFSIDPDSSFQVWLVGSSNSKSVQVTECP